MSACRCNRKGLVPGGQFPATGVEPGTSRRSGRTGPSRPYRVRARRGRCPRPGGRPSGTRSPAGYGTGRASRGERGRLRRPRSAHGVRRRFPPPHDDAVPPDPHGSDADRTEAEAGAPCADLIRGRPRRNRARDRSPRSLPPAERRTPSTQRPDSAASPKPLLCPPSSAAVNDVGRSGFVKGTRWGSTHHKRANRPRVPRRAAGEHLQRSGKLDGPHRSHCLARSSAGRYHRKRVAILFVGESPPAGGTFFCDENSTLYFEMRTVFEASRGNSPGRGGTSWRHSATSAATSMTFASSR